MTLQLLWQWLLSAVAVEQVAAAGALGSGSLLALFVGPRLLGRRNEGELFTDGSASRAAWGWLLMVTAAAIVAAAGVWLGRATLVLCSLIATQGVVSVVQSMWSLGVVAHNQKTSAKTAGLVKDLHLESMSSKRLKGSILGRVLIQLRCLGKNRAHVDVRSLVESQTGRLWSQVASVVSNAEACQSMGLLGTVIGMTLMFGKLGVALQATDAAAGDAALNEAMSGLGAAFVTTLVSCFFASIVLRVLASIGESKIRRLESDVTATAERCWFDSGGDQ